MVGQERPGKTAGAGFFEQGGKSPEKQSPVLIIEKDIAAFDPSDNHVLKNPGYVESCCAWHGRNIAADGGGVN